MQQAVLRFDVKASVYYGKGDIRVESVPDPEIKDPTDVLVRITHACIRGSDLWFYRGYEPEWKHGFRTGHEWMGIVERGRERGQNCQEGRLRFGAFRIQRRKVRIL
jgi:threonine dehydrogenase-like Zn-dependent dehydrogenase